MKVFWTQTACRRLNEISAYIASDSPGQAKSWADGLFAQVDEIARLSLSGNPLPEVDSQAFRELRVGNYRLIYKVDGDTAYVLTLRHVDQAFSEEDF